MRMNFFNGEQEGERKIAWVKWSKVLASKKFGGLGVSSFFALNRALIFKWVLSAVLLEGGAESHQLSLLTNLLDTVILSNMKDIWLFDLNEDGRFCVKDVRCLLDDVFLPKAE
nr:RNA-directed DNA polymerase, eukaryota [Tanacetum cinerariifolium]